MLPIPPIEKTNPTNNDYNRKGSGKQEQSKQQKKKKKDKPTFQEILDKEIYKDEGMFDTRV